jgi:hypothetical protein
MRRIFDGALALIGHLDFAHGPTATDFYMGMTMDFCMDYII